VRADDLRDPRIAQVSQQVGAGDIVLLLRGKRTRFGDVVQERGGDDEVAVDAHAGAQVVGDGERDAHHPLRMLADIGKHAVLVDESVALGARWDGVG